MNDQDQMIVQHMAQLMMVRAILKIMFLDNPNKDEIYTILTGLMAEQIHQPPYNEISPEAVLLFQKSADDFLREVFAIQA